MAAAADPFVLRKTLAAGLPVILVVNQADRADARIAEVMDACYELFLDLDARAEWFGQRRREHALRNPTSALSDSEPFSS